MSETRECVKITQQIRDCNIIAYLILNYIGCERKESWKAS